MAKKMEEKDMRPWGLLLLVLGVLFLLQDLGKWNFWGVSWYTALFLLMGVKKSQKIVNLKKKVCWFIYLNFHKILLSK